METVTLKAASLLEQYRSVLHKILDDYVQLIHLDSDVRVYVLVSQDQNHFMLMHEGWQRQKRLYGAIVHAEIRDDKIWIHYDGTEDGITDELLASGMTKDQIVLAFHPPDVRQHTGYAIA
jgi:gluconate kinase